jgi:hypothetical protein
MNKLLLIILGALSAVICTACPQGRTSAPDSQAGAQPGTSHGSSVASATPSTGAKPSAVEAASQPPGGFFPPTGPPKQVILFYTGDTLSTVQPKRSVGAAEGGLCALAEAIGAYQNQLVDLNRVRVENEGGDPSIVRADLDAGMLGEHPYLLMDYGGWERPNDFAGSEYVALYFRFFTDYHYCAVAGRLYQDLKPERWQAYSELDYPPTLLVTGPAAKPGALACQPLVTRKLHGQLWGIAAPPLPATDQPRTPEELLAELRQSLDAAQARFTQAGCAFSIVLLGGAPTDIYREQVQGAPFTVIIGCDRRTGVREGYGEMPEHGPLMLPEVDGSGRGAAVCHLYFEPNGDKPVMYYFTLLHCEDDETQPWPYRHLVREAVQRHHELAEAGAGGAK